jgi:hypothetical protein
VRPALRVGRGEASDARVTKASAHRRRIHPRKYR